MFGTQAMRLLRTKWKTPTLLAQELFAMFQSDIPLEHSGGLKLDAKNDAPALELSRGDFGDGPVLDFNGGSGAGGISFSIANGGLVITGPSITLVESGTGAPPATTPTPQEQQQQAQGSTFPGQVLSGSGQSYVVRIFTQGEGGPASQVTAQAPGMADDATISEGFWVAVSATTDAQGTITGYFFFPPVWGGDL